MHEEEIIQKCSTLKGDPASVTRFPLQTHWYTHIDATIHQFPDGKTLNEYPLSNLFGTATVLDVSYVKDNQPISAEMLKEALGDDEPTKIILIKTCWQDSRGEENWFDFWQSHDYWDEAPYMTDDAADFLTSLKPNVIGFDFPQDYDIRKLRFGVDERHCYLTTHRRCLRYEIMMIEYMSNFRELKNKYVEFVGLPTALENADGAQIRCVAIVDED
jgi:kynurenine formamidase